MKKKTKVDFEVVRKLMFSKNLTKRLTVDEVAKKLGCTRDDITKAMREWTSSHTYDPISRKWS